MQAAASIKMTSHKLRITIARMIKRAGSGHIGGSFSCVELLTVLYDNILNVRPDEPLWEDRDRFVLSKGHAAPALYATLARKGFFDQEMLYTLRDLSSCLQGHPCMFKLPGVDMSTGSLGMGISVGVGMALSAKLQKKDFYVYVLCGDGELQEGQNWEGFSAAAKWKLDNLVVMIDHNNVQLDGTLDEIMPAGNLADKIGSFGIKTFLCDGHDPSSVYKSLTGARDFKGPTAVIAKTAKGKGVSFMENKSEWHGKVMSDDEYDLAMNELQGGTDI